MQIENKLSLSKRIKNKKYSKNDRDYFKFLKSIENRITPSEAIFQIGLYIGQDNLSRHLTFYELYKKTLALRGNCCDVGTWKGSSFLFLAKLIKIFEPYAKTKVYAFDWFRGQKPTAKDNMYFKGMYKSSYLELKNNIKKLKLSKYAIIKKMNIVSDLSKYIKLNPWLEFKYAFVDCGSSDVIEATLKNIWPRIVKNGILVLDHAGMQSTPRESQIVRKFIGKNKIEQLPFSSHPAGYVIKKF